MVERVLKAMAMYCIMIFVKTIRDVTTLRMMEDKLLTDGQIMWINHYAIKEVSPSDNYANL